MDPKRIFMPKSFTISQEIFDVSWNMPYEHFHNSYEMYFLKSGERTVLYDGAEYLTAKNDVMLFDKNVPHKSRGTTPFSGICIHVLDQYLEQYFTKSAVRLLMRCFNSPMIHLTDAEMETIKGYADGFIPDAEDNFIILAEILKILNRASERSVSEVKPAEKPAESKTQQILKYVNENYIDIKKVSDISEHFSVSERYIFKLFDRTYSATPKMYINRLKLRNACRNLKNSDGTIKSISQRSGFDCYEYFLRLFKKELGCTPNEYRRKNGISQGKKFINDI